MENNTETIEYIDLLLQNRIAFACWFNPRDSRMGLVIGNKNDVSFHSRFDQLNGHAGFVFAPFRITESSPAILLRPAAFFEDFITVEKPDVSLFEPFDSGSN